MIGIQPAFPGEPWMAQQTDKAIAPLTQRVSRYILDQALAGAGGAAFAA